LIPLITRLAAGRQTEANKLRAKALVHWHIAGVTVSRVTAVKVALALVRWKPQDAVEAVA
jgi:hypothetical protein